MGSEFGVTAGSSRKPNFDGVGIWWTTWAGVWTLALLGGMAFLIRRRNTPILRMRGIGLSLAAVVLLHLYYFSVQLGYVVGALTPGDCEYWIMGTYLPLGIALFHASNSRFLYVAKVQKKFLSRQGDGLTSPRRRMGLRHRFRGLNYTTKMVIVVGLGMSFQLFLTLLMWLMSRKWHSGWGIPGTQVYGTEMEQKMEMGRGWEWWPGIFWQFVWAWIVAPCVLWKSRNINDTHGWRFQTIGCALAGLHATPMWLVALYVPAMQPINKYFLPPQWICISILVLEMLTVFLPCWEVMQATTLRQETLDSIAQWERKNKKAGSGAKSVNTASTAVDTLMSGRKSTTGSVKSTDSQESILTMSALEYVLERNPTPLQEFSSLRDFSGENIAFLTSVSEWKAYLPHLVRQGVKDSTTRELIRERFNSALRIYAEFISIKDAEFPINISSTELKRLEAVFEASARILYGEKVDVDPATPFDFPESSLKTSIETSSHDFEKGNPAATSYCEGVKFWGEIPESFDETVFDESEKHIKYLVLTNTWPKFVKDRRVSIDVGSCAEKGSSIINFVRNRRHKG
ncbi:Regulator of G protein signaling superfamily [Metarhizium album ARSEF 1941]|uniref:Regulator of G protein signaling superfamily n=1 Tax=Metarhizium album (strain ARSEF 1941) TaxID=1081103 RepID=A0A0B2WNP5_METAS|nr:Regulator of G protein signaling superfamily [Metarhizium album ARSEF 1941]KHN95244.1 Regulator of G protein signaling superfamily [Metarhizium album ARSEF 1941]